MRRWWKGTLIALVVAGALGLQGMLHGSSAPATPSYTGGGLSHNCCREGVPHVRVHVHLSGLHLNR